MKLDLTISERDKRLLMVLFSVLIIAAAYYFGYNNIVARTDAFDSEIVTLNSKKRDLTSKVANQDKYVSDTSLFQQKFHETMSKYSTGTTQPTSFYFLNGLESVTGTWIKSVSFSNPTSIYPFGKEASSNPASTGENAYSTDMIGYKTTLTVAYEAEYGQWKNLVYYINKFNTKNTIDNITMSYSEAAGIVSGTMTVSMYTVVGSDRKFTEPSFDVPIGTDNIFSIN